MSQIADPWFYPPNWPSEFHFVVKNATEGVTNAVFGTSLGRVRPMSLMSLTPVSSAAVVVSREYIFVSVDVQQNQMGGSGSCLFSTLCGTPNDEQERGVKLCIRPTYGVPLGG